MATTAYPNPYALLIMWCGNFSHEEVGSMFSSSESGWVWNYTEVTLFDFWAFVLKGDATFAYPSWDVHTWNLAAMLWGSPSYPMRRELLLRPCVGKVIWLTVQLGVPASIQHPPPYRWVYKPSDSLSTSLWVFPREIPAILEWRRAAPAMHCLNSWPKETLKGQKKKKKRLLLFEVAKFKGDLLHSHR